MKPIIRWAGGKTWLLDQVKELTEKIEFKNYYEPFFGGGAIYFGLDFAESTNIFLSDLNPQLINFYKQVQNNVSELVACFLTFENSKEQYYEIRERFSQEMSAENAARFLYLNQYSFNGIYRVNRSGKYNVPYGYRNYSYDISRLFAANRFMDQNNPTFNIKDFTEIEEMIQKGDLIFLDPPYATSKNHSENGFLLYNEKLFTLEDQYRLKDLIEQIRAKGAYYILTNAYNDRIKEIFQFENEICVPVKRESVVGGRKASRNQVTEYLFTNIRTEELEDEKRE